MAYSNSTGDRMDELRFRQQQSPRNDSGITSPLRNGRMPPSMYAHDNGRGSLTRRFTTDSGRVPTITSIANQRGQEVQDYTPSTYHKVQLLEKKKLEYERLREQKRRFEAEMQLLDLQQRREEQELAQMQEDLGRSNINSSNSSTTNNSNNNSNNAPGRQSEPTTPPEYRESSNGFPSAFSRPNRYSTSSITSPPGLYIRSGRSGSQLTSPHSSISQTRFVMDEQLSAQSVPGSRRNSDEDEKEEAVRQDPTSHHSTAALNRYSMPVTKSRNGMHDVLSLDQTNTTRFLFGDDDSATPPPEHKNYSQMHTIENTFPTLTSNPGHPGMLSASSAALDLATSQSPGPESQADAWLSFVPRHRPQQHSLNMNTSQQHSGNGTPITTMGPSSSSTTESPMNGRSSYRHSFDIKSFGENYQQENLQLKSPSHQLQVAPPKLLSSYSANDVPTMKTTTNGGAAPSNNSGQNSHAQQHFHNHNASLGRIPPNATVNNRHSRELSSGEVSSTSREIQNNLYPSIHSALQANAPSFGPPSSQTLPQTQTLPASASSVNMPVATNMPQYTGNAYYPPGNYNMQMMAMGMQNMQIGQQMYSPANTYPYPGGMFAQQHAGRDSQARIIQQRRQNDGEAMNRFTNLPLESLGGEIYSLCKDQHGCRYLQKKLEDRNPEQVHMIWLETNQHVIELMTDPFGNYLCQKLLEYCNDEERTVLIENAAEDMVRIALNQHGTRALQKMIEYISTPGQIETIIGALRYRVVELIQDLNGNHVIQKCLNKLTSANAQFIFDAVGKHCIEVGTHRHGCCVLQRCIDHASGDQKAWLIRQISDNAFNLVQDPFGNYVVQYILDLNEPVFTEPLVAMFQGRVGQLARQKFSSNVIEKCLRCAEEASKDMLIEEMLSANELDRCLRDSFANYVIQTALDYASPTTRARLVEAIRPHLSAIRTTPYGRRIQAKIQGNDGRSGPSSGQATPSDTTSGQIPLPRALHQRGLSNASATSFLSGTTAYTNANSFGQNGIPLTGGRGGQAGAYPNPTQLAAGQGVPQQNYQYPYGRNGAQGGGGNYF